MKFLGFVVGLSLIVASVLLFQANNSEDFDACTDRAWSVETLSKNLEAKGIPSDAATAQAVKTVQGRC
ncbi:MAG: hypothetical protein EBY63_06680 [Flavobacteriia bacterium]|nr:hypothetical protein [Flavobacteriia bacterium]